MNLLRPLANIMVVALSGMLPKDYAAAYEALREGYAHTELLAAGLGGAIADQFPLKFPDTAMALQSMGRERQVPIVQ